MTETLDPALRARLMGIAVPTVVSTLWRNGFRNTLLFGPKPLNPAAVKFVGTAFTVRTVPVREDWLEAQQRGERPNLQDRAIAEIGEGEVLVVAMDGEQRTAFMGDLMTTHLLAKRAAGIVLDGAVSDAAAIASIPIPVFCQGNAATPVTSHRFVQELRGIIGCAGVPVAHGDVVVGDANGVAVIPRHMAECVADLAGERDVLEEFIALKLREGRPLAGTYPPDAATLAEYAVWRAARG